MKRQRLIVLAVVVAASALAFVQPTSAAEPRVCAGSALVSTNALLTFSGAPVTTSFTVSWPDLLWCPSLSGTLTANCTSWSGTGRAAIPQGRFTLSGAGGTLVLSGEVSGTIQLEYTALCNGATRHFRGIGSLTYRY